MKFKLKGGKNDNIVDSNDKSNISNIVYNFLFSVPFTSSPTLYAL